MPSPHEVEVFRCRYVANGNATQDYVEAISRAATWKRRSASRKAVDLMKHVAVRGQDRCAAGADGQDLRAVGHG
jgi:hypothetical protein